jgi:hypothetical protein
MSKLFRTPLALALLLGTGITVSSAFVGQNQVKAEVSVMADCCQEISATCSDRFGWKYADSRVGPICGPVES